MAFEFNPFTGKLDKTGGEAGVDSGVAISTDGTLASNSDLKVPTEQAVKTYVDAIGGGSIPQVSTDPVSPAAEDAWVLKSGGASPIGLLLALTTGVPTSYRFSYRTNEGTTVRVTLA